MGAGESLRSPRPSPEELNMNAKHAVKVGDDGTYVAIAKVVRVALNPSYKLEAHVTFEDGTRGQYALVTSFGTTDFGSVIDGGDHVVVRFAMEDQFARLVTMDELASRLVG
jgi:hypothetical protein